MASSWWDKITGGGRVQGDDEATQRALDQSTHAFDNINPDVGSPVNYQQFGVQPPDVNAAQQGPSAFNNISTDPRLKQAQLAALSSMQGIANNGGMTAADTANLQRIQNQNAADDQARRGAIMQNAQERGVGGGGLEMLNSLQSAQAATDRGAQQGLDVAGMAQNRAMQAGQNAGAMAGDLRAQDYGEQANAAKATDAINNFNTANSQQANMARAGMGMQSSMYNSGLGVGQENMNKVQLPQQHFSNNMGVASGKAGVYGQAAGFGNQRYGADTAAQGNTQGAIIGAAGKGIAGGMDYLAAAHGGRVPGHASVPGDSPANDRVPAMLSPGEVVVPRSVAAHPSQAPSFIKHAPTAAPGNPADIEKQRKLAGLVALQRKFGKGA